MGVVSVKDSGVASGHWEIASHQIGEALYYAPRHGNELWIDPVCQLLDSKENAEFRRRLNIRILNYRGVHGFSGAKRRSKLPKNGS